MAKSCNVAGCRYQVFGGGFCHSHQYFRKDLQERKNKREQSMHLSTVLVPKNEMSITKLIVILDDEFSKYVRRKLGDFCMCCTCTATAGWKSMDAGHYIPRDNMATRWNEQNVFPQCQTCNRYNDGFEHRFRAFLVGKFGEAEVQALEVLGRTVKSWSRSDLLELIAFYREENKKLE